VVALKVLHELQHRVSASLSMPQDQHFPSVCQCLCDAVKILSVESMASMSTVALASAGMRMNLFFTGMLHNVGGCPFRGVRFPNARLVIRNDCNNKFSR
jgi:hypothetical protein